MKLLFCLSAALVIPATCASAQPAPNAGFAVPIVSLNQVLPKPAPTSLAAVGDIVRGRYPLEVKYGDLDAGWRIINVEGQPYYTRGETLAIGDTEYLAAYAFLSTPSPNLTSADYVSRVTRGTTPHEDSEKLAVTLLPLSEVLEHLTGGATNLQPFNKRPVIVPLDVTGKPSAYYQNLSLVYLRKLGDALRDYQNSYLRTMPSMETAFAMRQDLEPFAENAAIFTQPGTASPFKANPVLSGRKLSHLSGKGQVIVFYEAVPAPDGSRAIYQFNGRVARVAPKEWAKLAKLSGLDG